MRANAHVYEDQNPLGKTIDQMCAEIDTTLTPEQQTYVNMLKKKISGGAQSQLVKCKPFTSDGNCHALAIEELCDSSSCEYNAPGGFVALPEFDSTRLEFSNSRTNCVIPIRRVNIQNKIEYSRIISSHMDFSSSTCEWKEYGDG